VEYYGTRHSWTHADSTGSYDLLCQSDCFFSDTFDARKCCSISIDAKIMISLKHIVYGTTINSFRDYFQMGESTSRVCLKHFVTGVLGSDEICDKYF
jgi:hypothetical protein